MTTQLTPSKYEVETWWKDALCTQIGLDIFFPEREEDRGAAAKATCAMCPVKAICLETAMREERGLPVYKRHGIYGGTSPHQRLKIAKGPQQ